MKSENIIQIFVNPACSSSRKARKYLERNQIPHEVHFIKHKITPELIKLILSKSEYGTEEIMKHNKVVDEDLSLSQFIDMVVNEPDLLKSPFTLLNDLAFVGYKEDEFGTFLSRTKKLESFRKSYLKAI